MLNDVLSPLYTQIFVFAAIIWAIIIILCIALAFKKRRSSKYNVEHDKSTVDENKKLKKSISEHQQDYLSFQKETKRLIDNQNKAIAEQRQAYLLLQRDTKQLIDNQNKVIEAQHKELFDLLNINSQKLEVKYNTLKGRLDIKNQAEIVEKPVESSSPDTAFHNAFSSFNEHSGTTSKTILKDKGSLGELQTHTILINNFGNDNVFSNLYLPRQNGNFTQIDLLVITQFEIYIIEGKKWGGSVTGTDSDKNYIQTYTDDSGKEVQKEYYSPTRQNYGHLKAFQELFNGVPESKLCSIVVFNNLCQLDVISRTPVIHRDELISFIKNRQQNLSRYFKDSDLFLLKNQLQKYSCPDKATIKRHIEYCNAKKQ